MLVIFTYKGAYVLEARADSRDPPIVTTRGAP